MYVGSFARLGGLIASQNLAFMLVEPHVMKLDPICGGSIKTTGGP